MNEHVLSKGQTRALAALIQQRDRAQQEFREASEAIDELARAYAALGGLGEGRLEFRQMSGGEVVLVAVAQEAA